MNKPTINLEELREAAAAKQLVLPEIEDVPVSGSRHTKAYRLKYAHLVSMQPGQSIAIETRGQWAAVSKAVATDHSKKFKFEETVEGLRLGCV